MKYILHVFKDLDVSEETIGYFLDSAKKKAIIHFTNELNKDAPLHNGICIQRMKIGEWEFNYEPTMMLYFYANGYSYQLSGEWADEFKVPEKFAHLTRID